MLQRSIRQDSTTRAIVLALALAGCEAASTTSSDLAVANDLASAIDLAGGDLAAVPKSARAFAQKLGKSNFLVGVGNDGTNDGNDPAYNLGVTLDLHYHYLVGLSTEGGWPTWNSNPDYAGKRIREARARNVTPMFTQYAMAAHGDGNIASANDAAYMTTYWKDWLQLLATCAAEDTPVVIHLEPDFWGYLQQSMQATIPARVAAGNIAECGGFPESAVGMARCLVVTARTRAPKALIGFHASGWASNMDVLQNSSASLDAVAEAQKTVAFLRSLGAHEADFIAADLLDRDAGCYEVGYSEGGNTVCRVRPGLYWDESNQTRPHFRQAWAWSKAISDGMGLPMIWWQTPLGVPSSSSGTPGHFRDNRVRYMFAHTDELVAAGGVAMVFGTGAGGQTSLTTDNNQFRDAARLYYMNPRPLP